jgi:hypothetical protein
VKNIFWVLLAITALASCRKGKHNEEACNGDTRREVKLMTDPRATEVDTVPVFTTIEALGALDVPEVKSETERQDVEKQVYSVRCKVEEVDRKRDGDYHLLLKSGDKYLIAEVPNPECDYAATSSFLGLYQDVYTFIEENDLEGKEVTLAGVSFVDIDHHYSRKQADNNLELHPVLHISF